MSGNRKRTLRMLAVAFLSAGLFSTCFCRIVQAADRKNPVIVIATPHGGIQPQAQVDGAGAVHFIYFKGEPAHGDLFYLRSKPGTIEFSKPIRVNSGPGSAVAIGSIRGGQLALGRDGWVFVAWNGSQKAEPANPIKGTPMLCSRLKAEGANSNHSET